MFGQKTPTGVYSIMLLLPNIHKSHSGILCPVRLLRTTNIFRGGNPSGKGTQAEDLVKRNFAATK